MAYMCTSCYEVYNKDLGRCPKVNCEQQVVEIDELMLPVIIILNKKGYMTDFCCSGHCYLEHNYPYIAFSDILEELFQYEEIKTVFKDLPAPWMLEEPNGLRTNMYCLRCHIEEDDGLKKYKAIIDANYALLEFVTKLPWLEY